MAKRFKISDIPDLSGRTVFFDANIILYLFWPVFSKGNKLQHYSSIFGKLHSNKNPLAINTFVLSEVINRVLRIEWDNKTKKNIEFKLFRNSSEGQSIQKDIFDITKNKILKYFQVIDKQLTTDNIKNMLSLDTLDFNDKIILDVCKTHNMILLTNDADFANADIDILSANQKILKR